MTTLVKHAVMLIAQVTAAAVASNLAAPTYANDVNSPDSQSRPVAAERVKTLSLADLDLSTPEGVRMAQERAAKMARTLCTQLEDMDDLSRHANYLQCVEEALGRTSPAISHLAQSQRPAPAVAKNQSIANH